MTADLAGLRIMLNNPCRCGCSTARVTAGQWQNTPFCCDDCGIERGRLDDMTQHFIREFIKHLGRPTSPIELRHQNYIETSSQPPGAGAQIQSPAPTEN
jgi:hypothetical protein